MCNTLATFTSQHANVREVQYVQKKSPSKAECEDAFVINDRLGMYAVMDGATPIDQFKDSDRHNGAYLAANIFKKHFESLKTASHLHHEIVYANKLLKQAMKNNDINLDSKPELWSTCVSVVQISENYLEYASVGDTMILACNKLDEINVLTVNSVKNISARARMNRELKRSNGIQIPDETFFEDEQNKIRDHRKMANTPNGYSVANGMDEVKNFIQHGMLPTKNLKHVLIVSDGMYDPKGNLREVYKKIEAIGLENYVEHLCSREKKSNNHSDDKTGVLLRLY